MSQDNVEIIRQTFDAFKRREGSVALDFYDAEIEWDRSRAMLGGVYRGHEGVRESFRDLLEAFSSIDFEVEGISEGSADCVLASVDEHYIGRTSGVAVSRHHYAVFTFRNGKVARMCVYLDREEALRAAGLAE